MTHKRPRLYLEHIKEGIERIERYLSGKTYDDFLGDEMLRLAVERVIEIISEASRRLPSDMKARHPEIPWRQVAGVGNVLRHDYDEVRPQVIWNVATVRLAALAAVVEALLEEEIGKDGDAM